MVYVSRVPHAIIVPLTTSFRESEFAIGLSSGMVELWHIEKGNNSRDVGVKTISFAAHQSRIKGMAICNDILFTGESNGTVRGHNKQGICLFEQKTEARITCLTVTTGSDDQNGNEADQSARGKSESGNTLDDIKKKETVKHSRPLVHC